MKTGQQIEHYIPQRAPFVFIDTIDEVSATTAQTRYTIPAACPLVSNTQLTLAGLMENAAQTCAVRAGNKIGYIGAIKQMDVIRLPKVGDELVTKAVVEQEVLNICLMNITTSVGSEQIASTTMKIAVVE